MTSSSWTQSNVESRALHRAVAAETNAAAAACDADTCSQALTTSSLAPSLCLTDFEVISNKTLTGIHRCVSLSLL